MFTNVKLHEVSCITASLNRWVYETQIYFFAEFGDVSNVRYCHREPWITAAARCLFLCTALQRGLLPSLISGVTEKVSLLVELKHSLHLFFSLPCWSKVSVWRIIRGWHDFTHLSAKSTDPNKNLRAGRCRVPDMLTSRWNESTWAEQGSWKEAAGVDFGWVGGYIYSRKVSTTLEIVKVAMQGEERKGREPCIGTSS